MTVQTLPATVPDSASAALRVVMKPVESIHPYENNPRHNDSAVPYVKNSIQEFGFKVPIIVDEAGSIVCGHTRYKAALELGMSHVPCIVASDLTPKQIQAFRLADNKVSEFSSRDFSKLEIEIGEPDAEFNLDDFGFFSDSERAGSYYRRIHHAITWNNCVPKIIRPEYRKPDIVRGDRRKRGRSRKKLLAIPTP